MKSHTLTNNFVAAITALLVVQAAEAAPMYWDSNGATAGAGVTPTGTWGTDDYWSTSSAGTVATPPFTTTSADDLNFSAGTDTVGAYTVTLNGTQVGKSVTAKTGNLTLSGGTLALANNLTNGSAYLVTAGTANLTVDSTLLVNNSTAGNNFLNLTPVAGTTVTINGPVTATNNAAGNRIYIRQTTGAVVINTNLGSDAGFKTGLQAGGIDGASAGGTLTLNGAQDLGTMAMGIASTGKTGVVNLGGTVNTGNAVTLAQISVNSTIDNMAGATVNVNSAVSLGASNAIFRNGGILNVAGSLTTTGNTFLGVGATGNAFHGGAINILNGGVAALALVQVGDNLALTNGGTLTGTTLTLGESTGNTSGKFVVGDATGTGSATFTSLATSGTGTANAIVGGNSAISTFTLNNGLSASFSGSLGGTGGNENNLALVKGSAGALTLSGVNTYTGNTTINSGTLILADNAALNFKIGTTGVNNGIGGTGILTLNGDFTFDLSGAAATGSWSIVDVGSLTESFGATFTVASGFAETFSGSNIWQKTVGPSTYTFTEANGLLTAVPEPGTWVLVVGAGSLLMLMRRRRRS